MRSKGGSCAGPRYQYHPHYHQFYSTVLKGRIFFLRFKISYHIKKRILSNFLVYVFIYDINVGLFLRFVYYIFIFYFSESFSIIFSTSLYSDTEIYFSLRAINEHNSLFGNILLFLSKIYVFLLIS